MTSVIDAYAELIKFLPKTLTLSTGDTVNMTWAEELADREPEQRPYGTIARLSTRQFSNSKSGQPVDFTEEQVDNIAYSAGVDVYQVSERHIGSVTTLLATVGATTGITFTEGVDFDIHQTSDYSTPDAIKFTNPSKKPDDGTQFTITYEHVKVREEHKDRTMQVFRLFLVADDVDGTGGYLTKVRVMDQMIEGMEEFLSLNRGVVLGGFFKLHGYQAVLGVSTGSSDVVSRSFIDIELSRLKRIAGPETIYIGKLDLTADVGE